MEPGPGPAGAVREGKAAPAAQGRSLTRSGAGPGVSLASAWLMRPRAWDLGQRGGSIRDSLFAAMRSIMAARRWFHAVWQAREGQP
jgi:hypothetical protein